MTNCWSRNEMLEWNGVPSHHLCTNETISKIALPSCLANESSADAREMSWDATLEIFQIIS